MKKMTSNEIRKSWIEFFESKQHLFLEPVSLIPKNDNSLLWINSGVATLKKYFSGQLNPPSKRLVNSQKAIRTNDIYNVGKTARHHTLFEMLGNFSIGDYFKEEAIEFAFELLIKKWEIDINKLWITIFETDNVAYNKWIELGINKNQILRCSKDRNFWDIGSGPCGPCTEIYYDRGEEYDFEKLGSKLIIDDIENDRYVEIWNIVFSEFNNDGKNNYTELFRKNIDTGAGLERLCCISQNVPTNFDSDLFINIINAIEKYSNLKYDINNFFKKEPKQEQINFYYRVIADHLRASIFAIADGAIPSNKDRGYILRRLIRRLMIYANKLNITNEQYLIDGLDEIIKNMGDFYPFLIENKQKIIEILVKENELFKKTLNNGLKYFNECLKKNNINPQTAFELCTTYGFPIEIINEICEEKNVNLDLYEFDKLFKQHQKLSNAKKNIIGMQQQNSSLLNIDLKSEFDYNALKTKAKVIYLLNSNFEPVNKLNDEEGYAIFDKTVFYATSGGQINDTGYVNKTQFVDDVIKLANLQHLHHSNNFNLELNEDVELEINENNRFKLMKQHSSEHLLHSALKNIVDKNIKQEGAFKSLNKITFDFQHHKKLDLKTLKEIENWVNDKINQAIEVDVIFTTLNEAKQMNAAAYFEDVYKKISSKLRVIKMGDVSVELCGGTHVKNTKDIEKFNIISFYSKGSGTWRIEATTTENDIKDLKDEKILLFKNEISKIKDDILNIDKKYTNEVENLINNFFNDINSYSLFEQEYLFNEIKAKLNEIKKQLINDYNKNFVNDLKNKILKFADEKNLIIFNDNIDNNIIKNLLDTLINEKKDCIFLIIKNFETKLYFYIGCNKTFAQNQKIDLNDYIKLFNENGFDAKAGGKPNYIQGSFVQNNFNELVSFLKQNNFKLWE